MSRSGRRDEGIGGSAGVMDVRDAKNIANRCEGTSPKICPLPDGRIAKDGQILSARISKRNNKKK